METIHCSLSTEFVKIADVLSEFMDDGICDENIHHCLSTIEFEKFENIMNFLTNQKPVRYVSPLFSVYKIDMLTQVPSLFIDMTDSPSNMFYNVVQLDGSNIFLNCLQIDSLANFIKVNSKEGSKYVFIPVVFGSEIDEVGHASSLVFNKDDNICFFLDPNGRTNFFDDSLIKYTKKSLEGSMTDAEIKLYTKNLIVNTEVLLEKLLEFYVNQMNEFIGTKYTFMSRKSYSPKIVCLNGQNDSSVIGSGHCVIVSMLLMHYLSITDESIVDVYNNFGKINYRELIEIINSYSVGFYNMLLSIS